MTHDFAAQHDHAFAAAPPAAGERFLGKTREKNRQAGNSLAFFLPTPMKIITKASIIALLLSGLALTAHAQTYTENPDAGQSPGSASGTVSGSSPAGSSLTDISGVLSSVNDADLYVIMISDFANFSATTVGFSLVDTQLFLFTMSGTALYTNDDASGLSLQSTLPAGSALGPQSNGLYLLGISANGYDPVDSNNQLVFNDPPNGDTTAVRGRRAGVGDQAGFFNGGAADSGSYSIRISGAAAAIPEPSTYGLIAVAAAAGLGFRLRRNRRFS